MSAYLRPKILRTLAVPAALSLLLLPFSFLTGWSLNTVLLYWFILTPAVSGILPGLLSRKRSLLLESITGMLCFYAIMVFLIYEHYQSDLFLMMMISCGLNVLVTVFIFKFLLRTDKPVAG